MTVPGPGTRPAGARAGNAAVTSVLAVLALAVLLVSSLPVLQFPQWQWIALALAAPVVLWPPVHRAALRGGPALLVSVAALAALAASLHALLLGDAGRPGLTGSPLTDGTGLLLDAAAGVVVLGLLATAVDPVRTDDRTPPPGPAVPDAEPRAPTALVVAVLGAAVAALGFRWGAGDGPGGADAAVAVLLAGCPCALLLAVPLARRAGPIARVDTLLLTSATPLRSGRLVVRAAHPVDGVDADELRRLAAALHAGFDDPVTAALTSAALDPDGLTPDSLTDPSSVDALPGVSDRDGTPGAGLRGVVSELVDGTVLAHAVLVGPAEWLSAHGIAPPSELPGAVGSPQFVAWDGVARGMLDVTAAPRVGAEYAVAALRALGVTPLLLVDPADPAGRAAAAAVGIESVHPDDRSDRLRGRVVATLGDTPDLAAALPVVRAARRGAAVLRAGVVLGTAVSLTGAGAAAAGLVEGRVTGLVPLGGVVLVAVNALRLRRVPAQQRHPIGATER